MNTIYGGVSIVYAALCLLPAVMKISGTAQMRAAAEHFDVAWTRYRCIGLLELTAAAAVLVGLHWRPAGLVGAGGMVLLLVGALGFHRRAGDAVRACAPALVFLVASIVYLTVWAATPSSH